MAHYGEQVLERLERFVDQVEARTSAELVLVLARRAEAYPDVPYKFGALTGLATLVALMLLPVSFPPALVLLDVVLAFGLGALAGRRSAHLARWLTSRRRRAASVQRAARAAFVERGVGLTGERTGVLLFVAWLEREVELLVDVGVERQVPQPAFNVARRQLDQPALFERFPDQLLTAFEPLAELLAERLPVAPDDLNEISNRPVIV